jgi:hypothetical protein
MIAWVGTAASMLGSLLVAFGLMFLGFSAFIVGSSLWLWVAYSSKNKPLFWLNLWFMGCNIIGLWRAL